MNHLANVWVFSDNVERYAELMTGARQWGEKVYAIVQGNTDIDYVKALGADEIVILESHTDLQRVENYAETLASLLGDQNGLLLMAAAPRGDKGGGPRARKPGVGPGGAPPGTQEGGAAPRE